MLRSDGNGGFNISKTSTVTLGVALTLVGILCGVAVSWGAMTQTISDHCADLNIHHTQSALDDQYMPRETIEARLSHISESLSRIESKVDRLTD